MAHIRFSRDTDEVACGKGIRMRFGRGERFVVGCMRTHKHPGKCVAMAYDAAKADGVCYGCRQSIGKLHGFMDKKTRMVCDAAKYMVECAFCCQRFACAFNDVTYTQGRGCAASMTTRKKKTMLIALPGSDYVGKLFEVAGTPIDFENADPVCDGCIRSFIEQGVLKQTGQVVWW